MSRTTKRAKVYRKALREELACLWNDLDDARLGAINGRWSMRCDELADRIKDLTELVGPTPWGEVPITLLELGHYQRIHQEIGMDGLVDAEQLAEVQRLIERSLRV
jgi:hypothetical protein